MLSSSPFIEETAPYGPRLKPGIHQIPAHTFDTIIEFISSRIWAHHFDQNSYGAFMLGFDFHLTEAMQPKLIEINTNAGGLVSVIALYRLSGDEPQAQAIEEAWISALHEEFNKSGVNHGHSELNLAIVDENPPQQFLYREMQYFAKLWQQAGKEAFIVSPEELILRDDGLYYAEKKIHLIYNRLTDFSLEAFPALLGAYKEQKVALTPNPWAYSNIADKNHLLAQSNSIYLKAFRFNSQPIDEWAKTKKQWVFKPPQSAASKGVYRGDKISLTKLQTLPPDTIVQELLSPPYYSDGSKFDLRFFTVDNKILASCARHFTGQVMEMHSDGSGYRLITR